MLRQIRSAYSLSGSRSLIIMTAAKLLHRHLLLPVRPIGIRHAVYLRARTTDLDVYKEILLNRLYECALPFDPKVIIDAGANIGLASVYFANCYPKARIIALEPEKENFLMLKKNCAPYPSIFMLLSGEEMDVSILKIRVSALPAFKLAIDLKVQVQLLP